MSEQKSFEYEPTLQNIIDQTSLKWIFVGGKGGVGKTTCACALSILLSKFRKSVLLVSTDPAHSTSDAFCQRFSSTPSPVTGYPNLFVMEVGYGNSKDNALGSSNSGSLGDSLLSSIPGIDEAMGFAVLLRGVKKMEYDTVVFDTAPTGHTLKLLSFPQIISSFLGKFGSLGSILTQVQKMLFSSESDKDDSPEVNDNALKLLKEASEDVLMTMKDPESTTFICVTLAEFLPLYETERLIQDLAEAEIDCHNIIINQLINPPTISDESGTSSSSSTPSHSSFQCPHCASRRAMQEVYLSKAESLYPDMHLIRLPQLTSEIRTSKPLEDFSWRLIGKHQEDGKKQDSTKIPDEKKK